MSTRLLEYVQTNQSGYSVDTAGGIIRDVLLVKTGTSRNGRLYSEAVLSKAIPKYEGAACYGDHPPSGSRGERSVKDKIGWFEKVYLAADGLRSERLNLLVTHPLVPPILEAARRNPKLFGLSHNITGETRHHDGVQEVTCIESVNSVDIVSEPSATSGLHESRRPAPPARRPAQPPARPAQSLKELRESCATLSARLRALDAAEDQNKLTRRLRESLRKAATPGDIERLLEQAGVVVVPSYIRTGADLARWCST
jgi:hypothetical protein